MFHSDGFCWHSYPEHSEVGFGTVNVFQNAVLSVVHKQKFSHFPLAPATKDQITGPPPGLPAGLNSSPLEFYATDLINFSSQSAT